MPPTYTTTSALARGIAVPSPAPLAPDPRSDSLSAPGSATRRRQAPGGARPQAPDAVAEPASHASNF
eukprot:6429253-Pyramimonas_sp.AAC.1